MTAEKKCWKLAVLTKYLKKKKNTPAWTILTLNKLRKSLTQSYLYSLFLQHCNLVREACPQNPMRHCASPPANKMASPDPLLEESVWGKEDKIMKLKCTMLCAFSFILSKNIIRIFMPHCMDGFFLHYYKDNSTYISKSYCILKAVVFLTSCPITVKQWFHYLKNYKAKKGVMKPNL